MPPRANSPARIHIVVRDMQIPLPLRKARESLALASIGCGEFRGLAEFAAGGDLANRANNAGG
jgi:hypothetical protein